MENKEIEKDNEDLQARYDADCERLLLEKSDASKKSNDDEVAKSEEKEIAEKPPKKTEIKSDDKNPENKEADKDSDQSEEQEKDDFEYRFKEAQRWGQEKNKILLASKRKVTATVNQLKKDGVLEDEVADSLLSAFNISDEDKEEAEEKSNPYEKVGHKIQAEFKNFKRYNKSIKDADARFKAFFNFFPMFTDKEKEETMDYLQDAEDNEAIEYVMTHGGELYDTLYKGVKEKGSVIKYLKDVHKRLEKAEKKAEELASELDSTTEKVYNRDTDSKVKPQGKVPTLDEFYSQRFS